MRHKKEAFITLARNLYQISSTRTLLLPVFSSITTYICIVSGVHYDLDILVSFFFVGIFFVFGISMNYVNMRRFNAIDEIAGIKAGLISILHILVVQKIEDIESRKRHYFAILVSIKDYLLERDDAVSRLTLMGTDKLLQGIEEDCEQLRLQGFGSPEISRIHQFLYNIYGSFERLKTIKTYRTPYTLKTFLYFSLSLSTIILAPQFATQGYLGLLNSFVVSLILSQIILIQNNIENPFIGFTDNISFHFMEDFRERINKL